jgi:hypothetical protein
MQRIDETDYSSEQTGSRRLSRAKSAQHMENCGGAGAGDGGSSQIHHQHYNHHDHYGHGNSDPVPGFGGTAAANGEEELFILHFKTARMIEMDETIGDVTVQIADAEASILLRLRKEILDRAEAIIVASNAIFEFDAFALHSVAKMLQRCSPLSDGMGMLARTAVPASVVAASAAAHAPAMSQPMTRCWT